MASICGSPVCAGGKPKLKFTYTGDYVVRKDGVVELLTSGTIVFLEPKVIDVFMVGGGSSGRSGYTATKFGCGGGAGGYTKTVRKFNAVANNAYTVTIGAGGSPKSIGNLHGNPGGSTSFGTFTVNGGSITPGHPSYIASGYSGGSGGGGGVSSDSGYGAGGSDGANGEQGYSSSGLVPGGNGQNSTTREFGEPTGKLYAGGGGGGRYISAQTPVVSMGGSGGGGTGGWCGSGTRKQEATAGGTNTGGGGGGGAVNTDSYYVNGAPGGSGIVCFRDAQELPELAGTWVLNERLYPSQTGEAINENIKFTAVTPNGNFTGAKIAVGYTDTSTAGFYLNQSTTFAVYQFSNNKWTDSTRAISQITFPAGATASDQFRAWLANNATKQA